MRTYCLLFFASMLVISGCSKSDAPATTPTASSGGGGGFGSYSNITPPTAEELAATEAAKVEATLPPLPDPNEPPSELKADDVAAGSGLRDGSNEFERAAGAVRGFESRPLLEWQIPHALDLKRAETGKFPKDWAEFQEVILDFNNLTLPELRRGYVYWYDAANGKLMKRPAASATPDSGTPPAPATP